MSLVIDSISNNGFQPHSSRAASSSIRSGQESATSQESAEDAPSARAGASWVLLAGVRRTLAPGIKIYGSFGYARWTGELVGTGDDNRGLLAVSGVRLNF